MFVELFFANLFMLVSEKFRRVLCLGFGDAVVRILLPVVVKLGCDRLTAAVYSLHYRALRRSILKICSATIAKYSAHDVSPTSYVKSNEAFSVWFQGQSQAPEVVQMCLKSVSRVMAGRHLVLDRQALDSLGIPDAVMQRVGHDAKFMAVFSDVVRLALLSQRGGVWFDATLFVHHLPPAMSDNPFYSIRHALPSHAGSLLCNPSVFMTPDGHFESKWTAFFLQSHKGDVVSSFAFGMMCEYWSKMDFLVDYFLIDAILRVGYESIPRIKDEVDAIPVNNDGSLYALSPVLNQQYDEAQWNVMCCNPLAVFKLNRAFSPDNLKSDSFYFQCVKS